MSGRFDELIKLLRKALELEPDFPEAHNNLGIAFKKQYHLDAAIASYKTYQIKHNYPEAHYNLGIALHEKGDLDAAVASFKTALQLKHNYPDAHNNLGNALREKGDLDAAIASYKTAAQLKNNHVGVYNNLGNVYREKGDLDAAIAFYKTELQFNNFRPDVYNNLGSAFREKGDIDEALISYRRALELDPKNSQTFCEIGRVQEVKGNFKDSKNSFRKAICLDPNNVNAIFGLSKNIEGDEDLKELAKILDEVTRIGLNKRQESRLEFALANFHHKSMSYANATLHLAKANKLKISYYPSDLNERLLRLKRVTELAKQISVGKPNEGKGRIFIVGVPRCGSTLLESVLSTDPKVCDLGESEALGQAFSQIISTIGAKETTPSLSDIYAEKTKEALVNCTHTVDKNLYNFCFVEAIVRAMPSARIIHCRRHPLDNILSMLKSNLKVGHNYTSIPLDAAKFLISQERTMSGFKAVYEKHIFTFDYDAFTANPEKMLRPLIDWLGLDWHERLLRPEANHRYVNTASVIQVRKPINSKSVGGWKNYSDLLKSAEQALIESKIFDL